MLVPESPRWLLEQNAIHPKDDHRAEEALEILKSVALKNGISATVVERDLFPPQTKLIVSWNDIAKTQEIESFSPFESIEDTRTRTRPLDADDRNNEGILQLFSSPNQTRLTLLLWATWFGLGFLYYGVILAVSIVFTNEETEEQDDDNMMNDDFGGDENRASSYEFDFTAIFITASSEIFGLIVVLFTIDPFGRIPSQKVTYRIGGMATFFMGIYSVLRYTANGRTQFDRNALIGLAFIARMAMMGATCTTWVSTSEMLSTDIRSTGHGVANAMGRLGGFVSPYFITEGNSLALIGVIVLFFSFITAECANRLPETAGKSMGTIEATTGFKQSLTGSDGIRTSDVGDFNVSDGNTASMESRLT